MLTGMGYLKESAFTDNTARQNEHSHLTKRSRETSAAAKSNIGLPTQTTFQLFSSAA